MDIASTNQISLTYASLSDLSRCRTAILCRRTDNNVTGVQDPKPENSTKRIHVQGDAVLLKNISDCDLSAANLETVLQMNEVLKGVAETINIGQHTCKIVQ